MYLFKNAFRNKWLTAVNITGLSIGLAVSIMLLLLITNELSYDKHFANIVNATSLMLMDSKDIIFGIPRDWEDFAQNSLYRHVLTHFPGASITYYPKEFDDGHVVFGATAHEFYAVGDFIASMRVGGYSFALMPAAIFGSVKAVKKFKQI